MCKIKMKLHPKFKRKKKESIVIKCKRTKQIKIEKLNSEDTSLHPQVGASFTKSTVSAFYIEFFIVKYF